MTHPAELAPAELLKSCDSRRLRRSGPGGQHRNKVETAVILTHRPTGVRAEASERRSQFENHRVATARLRLNLALQVRSTRPDTEGPSQRWLSRCRAGRFQVNTHHEDFPALLAETLDVLATRQWDVHAVASHFTITASQLIRFLRREPRALQMLNQQREARGQRPLK